MKWVSASEVIAFHDRILQHLPGVKGMSDPGRAEAIIYRVQNRFHYEGVNDILNWLQPIGSLSRVGTFFNDGNKRTAFFITMTFLARNGYLIADEDTRLEELTVLAATGEATVVVLADALRQLAL